MVLLRSETRNLKMASGIWDGYDRLKGGVVALGSAGGMEESG